MSEETPIILEDNLLERIKAIRKHLRGAEMFLSQSDYLRCAMRLQRISKEIEFDSLLLNILGVISKGD